MMILNWFDKKYYLILRVLRSNLYKKKLNSVILKQRTYLENKVNGILLLIILIGNGKLNIIQMIR